jgi:nitrogen fixation protein FixH
LRRTEIALAAAVLAGLGAILATVWVGASVREDTVVAHPYEDGLRHDAERHARAALGLEVTLAGAPEAGLAPIAFELRDRDGRPVDDATVTVSIGRPDTSRGVLAAPARALGAGRWSAELAYPEPGPWDVRLDVVRGKDRVRLERRVGARAGCDLAAGPCTRALDGGGEVVLELSPRPVRTMKELSVRVIVRPPAPITSSTVSFVMPGMTMGENRSTLSATAPGTYEGKAVLVRCPSGRRDWAADVELATAGGPARSVRFAFTVPEDGR